MGKGTLTIYSASAGSGKTYTLTEIYLSSLFRSRYNYRRILAVTFTNKATAEMKSRILDNLYYLSSGKRSDYLEVLMAETGKSEDWIRKEAGEILQTILHDFSRFSISTIDSFFQKILRSFTREAGLHSGFSVELDHSAILSSAVDEMLGSAVEGTRLNRWLTGYALRNIEEDRSWNLKEGILRLSEELFREEFKILSEGERSKLGNKEFLQSCIEKLRNVSFSFENELVSCGRQALEIYEKYNLSDEMFFHKGSGVPGYIRSLAGGMVREPNSYVREIAGDPPKWSTGKMSVQLEEAVADGLGSTLIRAMEHYERNIMNYRTAEAILANVYALGILTDVLEHIHQITTTENSFLLSDAGEVLSLITGNDQSPFIYEKVGNRYENFMVDEFQDTSVIQWKNLKPLIDNSMAEGFDNLVVGDVKQSIYRWRNSDWRILGSELRSKVDNDRYLSRPLTTNWRSLSNIISFNNTLFSVLPVHLDSLFAGYSGQISFRTIFAEAVQAEPGNRQGGYVRLEFIGNTGELTWKDQVLTRLPSVVEALQDKGYMASDIGIIVRDNREGAAVLKTFIDYSNNRVGHDPGRYNYSVVSDDSLLLSNAHVISFIISVLKVVNDPSDMISRALMLRHYLLAKGNADAENIPLESSSLISTSADYLPDGYEAFLEKLKQMPLFEATESIISFFELGQDSSDVAYLSTFQDHVLNFAGTRSGDLQSFLDWWEETGSGKSVVLPGNQDAMRILTIHKSKGLEFRVVILPFLNWGLDHIATRQPILWVRPGREPFSEMGIVPVKYGSSLESTWFADRYREEKHSIYVDNINLLYVALTRAREVIYGFSAGSSKPDSTIAGVLKGAIEAGRPEGKPDLTDLSLFLDETKSVFELGEIPDRKIAPVQVSGYPSEKYFVNNKVTSLKLKLHGRNYFSPAGEEMIEKINYGKVMHEVFEDIVTRTDVEDAVRKAVTEGKLAAPEAELLKTEIRGLIESPDVKDWFDPSNEILREAEILVPSGETRRPDRVIFRNGRVLIVDFKFGEESPHHVTQVNLYRKLLTEMGYSNVEGYIWYVGRNEVKAV